MVKNSQCDSEIVHHCPWDVGHNLLHKLLTLSILQLFRLNYKLLRVNNKPVPSLGLEIYSSSWMEVLCILTRGTEQSAMIIIEVITVVT